MTTEQRKPYLDRGHTVVMMGLFPPPSLAECDVFLAFPWILKIHETAQFAWAIKLEAKKGLP